jgi:hypothetical protein
MKPHQRFGRPASTMSASAKAPQPHEGAKQMWATGAGESPAGHLEPHWTTRCKLRGRKRLLQLGNCIAVCGMSHYGNFLNAVTFGLFGGQMAGCRSQWEGIISDAVMRRERLVRFAAPRFSDVYGACKGYVGTRRLIARLIVRVPLHRLCSIGICALAQRQRTERPVAGLKASIDEQG